MQALKCVEDTDTAALTDYTSSQSVLYSLQSLDVGGIEYSVGVNRRQSASVGVNRRQSASIGVNKYPSQFYSRKLKNIND